MTERNPHHRIDPFDLRLFAAAAEAGTITAGARAVHLSLAAASARLQALEQAMGTTLMRRAKTGVTLTDAGRTLLGHAGRLQREMDALHAGMAAHAQGVRSTVRLMCNTAAISEHLPPLLGPFLAAHPQLDIELCELDSLDVLFALRRQRADLGIVADYGQRADLGIVADYVATEGLSTRPWREDRLVAVLPAALARGLPRTLAFARLLELPFVGLPEEAGLSRFLQARALRHGRDQHHRVRVQGFDALMRLVADGVGVAVVPALTAERLASPRVRVRPLDDAWAARRLLVCFGAPETLAPGAAALLEALAPR